MLPWGYVVPAALLVCLGVVYAASTNEEDERTIRGMVDQAVARLNRGDVSALDDFWDENATSGMRMPITLALTER